MTELKECTRCLHKLELSLFSLNPRGEYFKRCDTCRKKINNYHNQDHAKEYFKKYYEANKDKKNAQSRKWLQDNKDYVYEKLKCDKCGSVVTRDSMLRHTKTKKCKTISEFMNTKNKDCVN